MSPVPKKVRIQKSDDSAMAEENDPDVARGVVPSGEENVWLVVNNGRYSQEVEVESRYSQEVEVESEVERGVEVEMERGANPLIDFTIKSPLTDATFVIEGRKIYAGSDFLSLHSSFFKVLLKGENFAERNKDEIELNDVTYNDFFEMLLGLVDTSRNIKAEFAVPLLNLGDRYDIKSLVDRAEDFLISNSGEINEEDKLTVADRYRLIRLQVCEPCQIMDYDQFEDCDEMLEVEDLVEPLTGFIASGVCAAEYEGGRTGKDYTIDVGGLFWCVHIPMLGKKYGGRARPPHLIVNKNRLMDTDAEWAVAGYVEVVMEKIDRRNVKEFYDVTKKFAFSFDNENQVGRMSKCAFGKEMRYYSKCLQVAHCTIHITAISGVRKSPSFDFTSPSDMTDAAFIVEGRRIHVNKQYLSTISSRFNEMFYKRNEVELQAVQYKEFLEFLNWIYPSCRRDNSASLMFNVLKVAQQLDVTIDTSPVIKYFTNSHRDALVPEKMIFFFEFGCLDENLIKAKNGSYESELRVFQVAYKRIKRCNLFAKMTPEKKNALYEWLIEDECKITSVTTESDNYSDSCEEFMMEFDDSSDASSYDGTVD